MKVLVKQACKLGKPHDKKAYKLGVQDIDEDGLNDPYFEILKKAGLVSEEFTSQSNPGVSLQQKQALLEEKSKEELVEKDEAKEVSEPKKKKAKG